MEITTTHSNEIMIVKVTGRLDTTHYNDFEKQLMQLIEEGNIKVVLDLEKLEYISSSGLRVFLMGLKRINARNGKLALCCLQESIASIFRIAGFNTIFKIYDDLDSAISYCGT